MAVDIAIGVAHMISNMLIYIGGCFHHSYVQCTHFSRLHKRKTNHSILRNVSKLVYIGQLF